MQELHNAILQAFQRNLDNKELDKILDDKMKKFFIDAVDSALSWE